MYILADSQQLFQSNDKKKLHIINYKIGRSITVEFQEELLNLFKFISEAKKYDEIINYFSKIPSENIDETIEKFIKLGVIDYTEKKEKEVNVMIIGVGTIGSHIVNSLNNLKNVSKMIIIDDDIVEESNLFRQYYIHSDVGEYKVDAILEKINSKKEVLTLKEKILTKQRLLEICYKYGVDVIIQSGDIPSTQKLAKLVRESATEIEIPCIINMGYMSNVIALPEFYFPGDHIDSNLNQSQVDLLLTQQITKANYFNSIQPSLVVYKQLEEFCRGNEPVFYKKRGFFNESMMKWMVE